MRPTTDTPPPQLGTITADTVGELDPAGADVRLFRRHLFTLADPFMEGRGPGTNGNVVAAKYLEFYFRSIGLEPAFDERTTDGDGATLVRARASFQQEFTAGSETRATTGVVSLLIPPPGGGVAYGAGRGDEVSPFAASDFEVLGCSGDGLAEGELVFVGYAVEEPPVGGVNYDSFTGASGMTDSLAGKIAVMMRFEPMDASGKSRWTDDGSWSRAAAMRAKIDAVMARKPAGLIIVNPPGAVDPRAAKAATTQASLQWSSKLDIPAVMLSNDAADRLAITSDSEGRSLRMLRELCDESSPGVLALPGARARLETAVERRPRITWNVGGVLEGRGDLADEWLVIGAHFDHVGYGYTGGSRSGELGVIHPGADDNASGTAGLLVAAGRLARAYEALPPGADARSIMFVGFSAEEMGLNGSRFFVRQGLLEASKITAMLNLDMIGRMSRNTVEVAGTGTAAGFTDLLGTHFEASGITVKPSPGGRGPSDHASFYAADIPVLHFFTGLHDEYHTPRDVVELINVPDAVRVVELVCAVAADLATRPEMLTFTSTDRARRGGGPPGDPAADPGAAVTMGSMKVRFGIAPGSYAEDEPGVDVGEVFPGTSAAAAGIRANDRLMKWNGKPIEDVGQWMSLMVEHKPGDVVDVTIRRDGQEQVVPVTLKARESEPAR